MLKGQREHSVAQTLRDLKHAVPFSPFRVKTIGGETFTVVAADDFIVSPRGESGFFNPQGRMDMKFLHLRDVRAIDVIRSGRRGPSGRSNGRGKK
jgi:hypothetical protein